jgi:hypothetical protein
MKFVTVNSVESYCTNQRYVMACNKFDKMVSLIMVKINKDKFRVCRV